MDVQKGRNIADYDIWGVNNSFELFAILYFDLAEDASLESMFLRQFLGLLKDVAGDVDPVVRVFEEIDHDWFGHEARAEQ